MIEHVLKNEHIAQDIYALSTTFYKAEDFVPGQFAHVKIPGHEELLLRRPISIHSVDVQKKELTLIYAVVGQGTQVLSTLQPGAEIDILAPLGNGFWQLGKYQNIWLIGGGIGISPLCSLLERYPQKRFSAFLGYRDAAHLYAQEKFSACERTVITTDDGSFGVHGFATDELAKALEQEKPDAIAACGPPAFFRSLKKATEGLEGVAVYASLEQHMGCGVGGCATCVCKVGGRHRKVCMEGPVFLLDEVTI